MSQCPRAAHGAFFVSGGKNDQGFGQIFGLPGFGGVQGQSKEAFHVTAAESVQAPVALSEGKRIRLPAFRIAGHRVRMTAKHQTAITGSQCRHQIGFADGAGNRQNHGLKPQCIKPLGQGFDHGQIALIVLWQNRADAVETDQFGEGINNAGDLSNCLRHGFQPCACASVNCF